MKVNVTIDDNLLKRLDEFAAAHYMTRSGLISYAVNQYLNKEQLLDNVRELNELIRKISKEGIISEAERDELLDYVRSASWVLK